MIIKNNKGTAERDRALFWVAKAAATDQARCSMTGVLFTPTPANHITAVATDGRRLHMATFPETCLDYWDVIPDRERPTAITRRNTREVVFGSLMDHVYPNYERVIPLKQPYGVNVEDFVGQPRHFMGQLLVAIQDAGHQIPRIESEYAEDVGEMPAVMRASFSTPDKAFRFDSLPTDPFQRMAVVMPMRRVVE